MKQFLWDWSVVTQYSPPYAPWYNDAIKRANCRLKEVTAHLGEQVILDRGPALTCSPRDGS
jgi:hypothetical protein